MIFIPKGIRKRDPAPGLAMPAAGNGLVLAQGRVIPSGVDEKAMCVTAVISTAEVDRVGDVVVPEGCDLTAYRQNPVVLFAHDQQSLPVGKAERPDGSLAVTIEPGRRVLSTCYFHSLTPESVQAFELVKLGVLRGTSVGFTPLSAPERLPFDEGGKPAGYRFKTWALSEWSFVAVPANPGCVVLRELLGKGKIAGSPISPRIVKMLAPLAGPRTEWANGAEVKAMNESSGTAGGYTAPPGEEEEQSPALEDNPGGDEGLAEKIEAMVMAALKVGLAKLQEGAAPPPGAAPPGATPPGAATVPPPGEEEEGEEEEDDLFPEEQDEEGGDEEEEDEEDPLARYRRAAPPPRRKVAAKKPTSKHKAAPRKAAPRRVKKALPETASVLKEATDHMGAMADTPEGTPWGKMHTAACKYHHGQLTKLCKALEEDAPPGEKPAEDEPTAEEVKSAIALAMAPYREQVYRLTGRRMG